MSQDRFTMNKPREDRGQTYKSAMSGGSGPSATDGLQRRRLMEEVEEDENEEPFSMPWVDKIKPRLAPDWLDFDRD